MTDSPIEIVVNGQSRTVPAATTVAALLEQLELQGEGLAIAVDRTIVPRSERHTTRLAAGVRVEILRAVGGG